MHVFCIGVYDLEGQIVYMPDPQVSITCVENQKVSAIFLQQASHIFVHRASYTTLVLEFHGCTPKSSIEYVLSTEACSTQDPILYLSKLLLHEARGLS